MASLILPVVGGRLTDGYSYRDAIYQNGRLIAPASYHRAQDIAAPQGTSIRAAHDGWISSNRWFDDTGWVVWVDSRKGWDTGYAHMVRQSTLSIGTRVKAGQTIGYVGSTGWSTGPHLHWMLDINNVRHDPMKYLTNSKPKPTPAKPAEEEDDEMKNIGFYYTRKKDKRTVYMLCNFGSGFCSEYVTGGGGKYNNPIARAIDSGSFAPITEGHAKVIKNNLREVRQGK